MARFGKTTIVVADDALDLGRRAAAAVAAALRKVLEERTTAVVIFAAAESQVPFLDALALYAATKPGTCTAHSGALIH